LQSIYFGLYKTALDVCCTAANLTIMKQIYTIDDKISIIVLKYLINCVILMLLKKSKMEPAPFYSLACQRIMNTIGEVFYPGFGGMPSGEMRMPVFYRAERYGIYEH